MSKVKVYVCDACGQFHRWPPYAVYEHEVWTQPFYSCSVACDLKFKSGLRAYAPDIVDSVDRHRMMGPDCGSAVYANLGSMQENGDGTYAVDLSGGSDA